MRICLNMRMLQWTAGVICLTFFASVGAAQTPEIRIGAALTRAQEAGIPIALLESKRAEGKAKGIPMDRIATAVENRLQHLERARGAMSRGTTDVDAALLSVGADAISVGVSEAALAEIAASAGKDRRNVAVAALTFLVSREGLSSSVALTRVKVALDKSPKALTDLVSGPGLAVGRTGADPPGNAVGRTGADPPGNAQGLKNSGPPSSVSPPGQDKPPDKPGRGNSADPPGRGRQ
jgi:hypothetical protein